MSGEIDSEYPKHPEDANKTFMEQVREVATVNGEQDKLVAVIEQLRIQRNDALFTLSVVQEADYDELKADYDAELMAMLRSGT